MASPGLALAEHFAGLTQAPLQQKIGYLITLAALIAVLGGMWMWSKAPDFRVLYANLSDRDGGAVRRPEPARLCHRDAMAGRPRASLTAARC